MVSRYVLSQCFSGGAYSPTYWAVKTVAGNMLGFNVERDGMPIPSSVATISTSISTAAPNASQWIHFLFQFSLKSSLTWRKILFFHSICIKASKIQAQFVMSHSWSFGLVVPIFVYSKRISSGTTFLANFTYGPNIQVLRFNVLDDSLFYLVD